MKSTVYMETAFWVSRRCGDRKSFTAAGLAGTVPVASQWVDSADIMSCAASYTTTRKTKPTFSSGHGWKILPRQKVYQPEKKEKRGEKKADPRAKVWLCLIMMCVDFTDLETLTCGTEARD